jgi:hypothetical protein
MMPTPPPAASLVLHSPAISGGGGGRPSVLHSPAMSGGGGRPSVLEGMTERLLMDDDVAGGGWHAAQVRGAGAAGGATEGARGSWFYIVQPHMWSSSGRQRCS